MDTKLFVRKQSGGMFQVVDRTLYEGDIWYVCSTTGTDGAGYGRNPDAPFDSLVYAEAAAAANDTIFVLSGHTETLASATGAAVLTLNLARLKVIGLGGRSTKPTFLIDGHANNYVSVAAADVVLENLTFNAGHADIVKGISVSAAGAELRNINMLENVATENFLVGIQTTAAADDMLIEGCFLNGVDASNTEGIELVGATNRVTIRDNYIKGSFSVSCISAITNACLDLQIVGNRLINLTAGDDLAGCIDLVASSTGMICDNRCYMEDNTDCLTAIDSAACARSENYTANENAQEGGYAAAQSA